MSANKLVHHQVLKIAMLQVLLAASVVDSFDCKICPTTMCCCTGSGCGPVSLTFCGAGCSTGPCRNKVTSSNIELLGNFLENVITPAMFDELFPDRLRSFYTFESFRLAASAFPGFATTGDLNTQKREVAALLAHIQIETSGLSVTERAALDDFCYGGHVNNASFACVTGKKYYPRGPLQLTWNYNYGSASKFVGEDLLSQPELVSGNAVISFKTALWVWMTPEVGSKNILKPSSHDIMTGQWSPSAGDMAANRHPGFGATINVMKGKTECGHASSEAEKRTQAYLRAAQVLRVPIGDHVRCENMTPLD